MSTFVPVAVGGDWISRCWADARTSPALADLPSEALLRGFDLTRGDGGPAFGSVTSLPPTQDLPLFAADRTYALPADTLDAFRRAHAAGGFHGAVLDRIRDRQGDAGPDAPRLLGALRAHWIESLADATGDPDASRRAAERAVARFEHAASHESRMLATGPLSLDDYHRVTVGKTAWFGLAAEMLLLRHASRDRWARFVAAVELLMLAAQCIDDATDEEEDRRLHGRSIPECLDFPAGGLVRAAPQLTEAAARIAFDGGFVALAAWCVTRAQETDAWGAPGDPLRNGLAGLVIFSALSERTLRALRRRLAALSRARGR